jgi:hypothetical protein
MIETLTVLYRKSTPFVSFHQVTPRREKGFAAGRFVHLYLRAAIHIPSTREVPVET